MSGWGKFGVALYCSTTLAATAVVGFALFIGATPSNINLFDKNRDIRNWVFIAAVVSLAYITLSAFTMFCILTTAKKSDLKRVSADDNNLLLQSHNIITSIPVKSAINSQQPGSKDIGCGTVQSNKTISYVNGGYNSTDVPYNPLSCFYSSVPDTPSSQLHSDQKDNQLHIYSPILLNLDYKNLNVSNDIRSDLFNLEEKTRNIQREVEREDIRKKMIVPNCIKL